MAFFRIQVELLSIKPDLEQTGCHWVVVNMKEYKNHIFNKHISSQGESEQIPLLYAVSKELAISCSCKVLCKDDAIPRPVSSTGLPQTNMQI